jgi:hypothetical protein
MIASDNAPELERQLHEHFALRRLNKVNSFKEFFCVSCEEIKAFVESMGLHTNWTLEAQAQQYEESRKIAKQLEDGTLSQNDYLIKWRKSTTSNVA